MRLLRHISLALQTLITSSVYFTVPMSTPPLPTLPILVDELNKTRDVYAFIKDVRRAFEDMVQCGH